MRVVIRRNLCVGGMTYHEDVMMLHPAWSRAQTADEQSTACASSLVRSGSDQSSSIDLVPRPDLHQHPVNSMQRLGSEPRTLLHGRSQPCRVVPVADAAWVSIHAACIGFSDVCLAAERYQALTTRLTDCV